MLIVDLMGSIATISSQIYNRVQAVETNRSKLGLLVQTIRSLESAIAELRKLESCEQFRDTLLQLDSRLREIDEFVVKLSHPSWERWILNMKNAGKHARKIEEFGDGIRMLIPLLSVGLQAQQLIQNDERRQREEQERLDRSVLLEQQAQLLRESQLSGLSGQRMEAIIHAQLASFEGRFDRQCQDRLQELDESEQVNLADLVFEHYLGRGEIGDIYQGLWRAHQPVAIRWIDVIRTEEERQRFIREVKILRKLNNPYVIPFYGACFEPGRYCFLTGLSEQGTLNNVLPVLTVNQRLVVARDLARGLAYLHEQSVVHANIQPKAVGITKHYQAQWIEFGFSKTTLSGIQTLREPRHLLPNDDSLYTAPETVGDRAHLTKASDMYSFGRLFEILMTKENPYIRGREDLNVEWQELVLACLNRDSKNRPTALEVACELNAFIASRSPHRASSPTPAKVHYEKAKQLEEEAKQEKDYSGKINEALRCYEKASVKGYGPAFGKLGFFKLTGRYGMSVNKSEALALLTRGAEQEDPPSIYNMARMYEKGDATGEVDEIKALDAYRNYMKVTESNTDENILKLREEVSRKVSVLEGRRYVSSTRYISYIGQPMR